MGGEASDRLREPDAKLRREVGADERARLRVQALLAEHPPRPGACLLCDRIAVANGASVELGWGGAITVVMEAQAWHLERCPSRRPAL